MATIEAGTTPEAPRDFVQELYDFVGIEGFPVVVNVNEGILKAISVETEWITGGTSPVESVSAKGEIVVDYIKNYKDMKLTKTQLDKVNEYIALNLEDS